MGRQYTIEHYLERLAAIRAAVPGISISTDVIVGFCGETREQFEATLRLLETVRYDQVFAAAYSVRPGTPATKLADDVPPAEKRARLNELLALQESIGLERNRAWLGREVEVLVDTVVPPRSHEHEGGEHGESDEAEGTALSGRTRGNKLVHLRGETDLVGRFAAVRVDHAGPYALRGTPARRVRPPPRRSSSWPARPRPARPGSRSGSPSGSRGRGGPPRSSRPIRGRSSAASTSARRR